MVEGIWTTRVEEADEELRTTSILEREAEVRRGVKRKEKISPQYVEERRIVGGECEKPNE